jgi:hypothetical protein
MKNAPLTATGFIISPVYRMGSISVFTLPAVLLPFDYGHMAGSLRDLTNHFSLLDPAELG